MAARRLIGLGSEPIFDPTLRSTWMVFTGLGVALAVAIGLTVMEYQERTTSQQMETDAAVERAANAQIGKGIDLKHLALIKSQAATQPGGH